MFSIQLFLLLLLFVHQELIICGARLLVKWQLKRSNRQTGSLPFYQVFWKAAASALLPVLAGLIPVATKVRVRKCVWMLDVALKKCRLAFLVNLLKRY